jgi:hypothetical protein
MKTINISHFIDKRILSKVDHLQDLINSDGFRIALEKSDKMADGISKINIATIPYEHRRFYELADKQRRFCELAIRNTGNHTFATLPQENLSLPHHEKSQTVLESDANLSQQFNKRDFVKIEYELIQKSKGLEISLKQALESNKELLKYKEKYLSEKKNGGQNSYSKYKPLKKKLKELCQSEMINKKPPTSALQLCKIVALKIETEFPKLLCDFAPYKNVKNDGGYWTRPTFYNWCNDFFKQAKTK